MKKFAIVDFEDDQGLETSIVPSEWIQMETGQCYWPDQGDPQRAVIDCLVPRKTWGLYSFKGIKYETDEYPKAAEKLKSLLQAISDKGSTSGGGHHGLRRKRVIHKKRCMSSSESDDEERFSAQQTKRSCVDKNGRSQGLPLSEFSPQPMIMKPRAASQLWNSQPTPQAQSFGMLPQHVQYTHMSYTPQPLRVRPRSSRPSSCMRPRPGTSSTNMQTFDDLLDPHHCEDHTYFGPGSSNSTDSLLSKLSSKIEEQGEILQNVVHKVNQISMLLQNVGDEMKGTAAIPEGLSLPVTSEQGIIRLEEQLTQKEFRAKLITHLSCIGGDNVTSLARRILKRMFSPPLALKYNFSGAKGKKSFQALQLRSILIAAVRKMYPATSETELDCIARRWFGNARDRDGRRIRIRTPSSALSRESPSLMG